MFKHSLVFIFIGLLAACDGPATVEKVDVQIPVPKVLVEDLSRQQLQLAKLLKLVDERLLQWNALTTDIKVEQTPLAIEHRDELVRLRQIQIMDLEKEALLSAIVHVKAQLNSSKENILMLSEWSQAKSQALTAREVFVSALAQETTALDARKNEIWAQTLVMENEGDFVQATKQWSELYVFFKDQLASLNISLKAKLGALESQQAWLAISKNVMGFTSLKKSANTDFTQAMKRQADYQYLISAKIFESAGNAWLKLAHQGVVQISMPNMLLVKGGVFEMGDSTGQGDKDELPVHDVTLPSYSMSQTEITFTQYDNYAKNVGKPLPNDEGWGRGQRPVINISWQDAHEFALWLSEKSGKTLRLPSEPQWEYAAKASKWNAQNAGNKANCEGCYKWDNKESIAVGQFPANALGLHDMQGNVWEWTADCYTDVYAPQESTLQASCNNKAVRGGSWYDLPSQLRSSNRSRAAMSKHSNRIGFRLVEELIPDRIARESLN